MTEQDDTAIPEILAKARIKHSEFSDIVSKINYASNETKKLWTEIYENALDDRSNASLLFTDLYRNVANSEKGHIDHGRTMTAYLERMNKANDQLLKLAELIDKAKNEDEAIDPDAVYNSIGKEGPFSQ
jgi:hypothetical protein